MLAPRTILWSETVLLKQHNVSREKERERRREKRGEERERERENGLITGFPYYNPSTNYLGQVEQYQVLPLRNNRKPTESATGRQMVGKTTHPS